MKTYQVTAKVYVEAVIDFRIEAEHDEEAERRARWRIEHDVKWVTMREASRDINGMELVELTTRGARDGRAEDIPDKGSSSDRG